MTDADISRLEIHLGRLLMTGVLCSTAALLAGLVLWALDAAPAVANRLLNAGLLVLMATPILRVLVSLVEYARMRDWLFVMTTIAVLSILCVSVAIALGH